MQTKDRKPAFIAIDDSGEVRATGSKDDIVEAIRELLNDGDKDIDEVNTWRVFEIASELNICASVEHNVGLFPAV